MPRAVDQKRNSTRRESLLAQIRQAASAVATAGSIVKTWRTYRGRRLGPYYRIAFRDAEVQKSIYIGSDPELATAARTLLAELQAGERARRVVRRLQVASRASLRAAKTAWERELERAGLHLQGFEVRGWRQVVNRSCTIPRERITTHERERT